MEDLIFWICILAMTALFLFCLSMAIYTSKVKQKASAARLAQAGKITQEHALFSGQFTHCNGLSLAEGVPIRCNYYTEKVCFAANGVAYNLPMENLLDICIRSDVDIEKQYVSNPGKAMAGGMVFGPIGALIGGRAKEKKTVQITNYLIFTYHPKNSRDVKYIALELINGARKGSAAPAEKMVEAFRARPSRETHSIDL